MAGPGDRKNPSVRRTGDELLHNPIGVSVDVRMKDRMFQDLHKTAK